MIPIVKGWSTEVAQEVTSLGRAGARRHGLHRGDRRGAALRDARIITIYEGTTGIQANDLIGRKTARDAGAVARHVAAEIDKVAAKLAARTEPALQAIGVQLAAATADAAGGHRLDGARVRARARARRMRAPSRTSSSGGSSLGGWQMGRAALICADRLAAGDGDAAFQHAKIATARYYADALLPQASALAHTVIHGGESALALAAEAF